MDRKTVEEILAVYADAWITRDPEKIVSIFTPDGIYSENCFEKSFIGSAEIKKYWQDKVVAEQSDVHFKLLNFYIDGNATIAEWDADFINNRKKKRIYLREAAILEIVGEKIKSLREYWHMREENI